MSERKPIVPMPQDLRWQMNHDLEQKELSTLDDNARFILRRMVTEAYGRGFDHGWSAGQNDADADRRINREGMS
jgi:hypothetical protein